MRVTCPLLIALAAAGLSCSTPRDSAEKVALIKAARLKRDFLPDGDLGKRVWRSARSVRLDHESKTGALRSELSTVVCALWSDEFLYLSFDCSFTKLTTYEPVQERERFGLWERDVVEAFIGSDSTNIKRYTEYEVSPTNERLDVRIALPKYDFEWSSRFESATQVDETHKRWTAEMRIPMSALSETKPLPGAKWRINLYRCDYANKAFLAFNPVLTGSFHTPERFGTLEFEP